LTAEGRKGKRERVKLSQALQGWGPVERNYVDGWDGEGKQKKKQWAAKNGGRNIGQPVEVSETPLLVEDRGGGVKSTEPVNLWEEA